MINKKNQSFTTEQDEFQFSTYEDIDRQFKIMQSQQSLQYQTENQINPLTISRVSNYSPTKQRNNQFQPYSSTNLDIPTEIMNISSSILISHVFQALVIHTIKENQIVESELTLGIEKINVAAKIVQLFGINLKSLTFMDEQQKHNYIKTQMIEHVDKILYEWKQKILNKQKKMKQMDEGINQLQQRINERSQDMFAWMILNSKYEGLHKKLREQIMQNLNDYENQINIIKSYSTHQKTYFLEVQKIQTQEIMYKAEPSTFNGLGSFKSFTNQMNQSTKINLDKLRSYFKLIWNDELETKFQSNRVNAKLKFLKQIYVSNFNQMAFLSFINDFKHDLKNEMQRDQIMKKYNDGVWLSVQELKFIADTSILLNSCVDKNMLLNQLSCVSQQCINDIETNLAESIIENYEHLFKIVHEARLIYLKKKIKNKFISNVNMQKTLQKQIDKLQCTAQYTRQIRKFNIICKKKLEKKKNTIQISFDQNFFVKIFVFKMYKILQEYRFRNYGIKTCFFRNKQQICIAKQQQKSQQLMKKVIKEKNHKIMKYHPSSKLKYFPPTEEQQNPGQVYYKKQYMREKENEYRLGINDNSFIREKDRFIKFYSTGPSQEYQTLYFNYEKNEFNYSKQDLQGIILIQRFYKKHFYKKKFLYLKEEIFNKKYKESQQKLYDLFQGHYISKAVRTSTITSILETQKDYDKKLFKVNFKNQEFNNISKSKKQIKIKQDQSLIQIKTEPSSLSTRRLSVKSSTPKKIDSNQIKSKLKLKQFDTKQSIQIQNEIYQLLPYNNQEKKKKIIYTLKHIRLIRYVQSNQFDKLLQLGFNYLPSDINLVDEYGNTALYYAAKKASIKFIGWLFNKKADPNIRCIQNNTPTHMAFSSNNIDCIMKFIENKADLNLLNLSNQTPLAYGSDKILFQLGMGEGITIVTNGKQRNWDNNKLLQRNKLIELVFK